MTSKTGAVVIKAAERRAYVLKRRIEGMSYQQIADDALLHFGAAALPASWGKRRAWLDVWFEVKKVQTAKAELAEEALAMDLDRLDLMLQALWPDVLDGGVQAIQSALRVMERRAKLLGMDAPTKVAPTQPEGDAPWNPYAGMTGEELDAEIDRWNAGPETAVPPVTEGTEEAPGT